jgi:FKBP-type peptidyl-prolyl cis-trans isomerase SlyD
MHITDKLYVAFDYTLTLDSGKEVDSSSEGQPLDFITGSGQIIPGLEKAMMGMTVGDSLNISVEPEDAYGQINPALFQDVPRTQFPGDLELQPGMTFQAQGPQGPMVISIKEIKDDDTVTIDLNHPLTGKRLHFNVNIVEVREPTAEELSGLSSGCNCGCSTGEQANCGTKGSCCQ